MTVLAVYAHVLLEWVFFLTKPSFMGALGAGARLGLLLVTPLPLVAVALLPLALLRALALVSKSAILARAGLAVPAALVACCAFLLIDNFTYTLFRVGVVSAAGPGRVAYATLLLGLLAAAYRRLGRTPPGSTGRLRILAALLLALSFGMTAWRGATAAAAPPAEGLPPAGAARPDVLILSGDGINAESMSAYGYERDTTPFIRQAMRNALVCQQAYPNANMSAASIVSMLTGKSPLRTGVRHHPPDILSGSATYEHLPAILRRLGYHGVHVGLRPHTDPFDLNMQAGFEAANFRTPVAIGTWLPRPLALAYDAEQYFLGQLVERLGDRLLHVAGVRSMSTAVTETESPDPEFDQQRVAALLDFLERYPRPVFAHLHLMGTHGPGFRPAVRHFATGDKHRAPRALYDDALLEFDRHVAVIFDRLRQRGTLASTLVVLTSDHGENWSYARIPLMFFFPGGAHAGTITANTQLLDVAPTVLDYLDVPAPEWMDGQSLLGAGPDPARPIISVLYQVLKDPPGLLQHSIAAMLCDRLFRLPATSRLVSARPVIDHPAPCAPATLPDPKSVERLLRELDRQWRDN